MIPQMADILECKMMNLKKTAGARLQPLEHNTDSLNGHISLIMIQDTTHKIQDTEYNYLHT